MKAKMTAALCTLGLTATIALGQSIEDIAPANSVVIAGVNDYARAARNFEGTRLYELIKTDHIQALMKEMEDDSDDAPWMQIARELDIDPEMLAMPAGAAGLAIFPVLDPEIGRPAPHMIALADYGDQADEIEQFIERLLERGEREGHIRYETDRILGRTVYSFQVEVPEPDPEEEFDFDFSMFPDPADLIDHIGRMHIARHESTFIFSSDFAALSDSFERMDDGVGSSIRERDDYRGVMSQVGEQNDGFAVILTRDMLQVLAPLDQMGMGMMIQPMLRSTFGDIHGYGLSVNYGTNDAMAEVTYSLFMPRGKGGLTSLIDIAEPRQDLPVFADLNAISYNRISVRFDRVVGVIRQVIQSNPMMAMELEQGFREIEPMLSEFFSTLGTEVITISSVSRPIDTDSHQMLVAIECTDEESFENFIGEFAPQIGFEPRDFLGQRIYTMDDMFGGMMMPAPGGPDQSLSLGIGGGYVLMGSTPGVEQALRLTSQPGEDAGLAEQREFQRAMRSLPEGDFTSWGFTSVIDTFESTVKMALLSQEQMMREMQEDFPEWAEEDMPEMTLLKKLDLDLVRQYIGPMISTLRPTENGFVGVSRLLPAE